MVCYFYFLFLILREDGPPGLVDHDEVMETVEVADREKAEQKRTQGNQFYKDGEYLNAVRAYSEAISLSFPPLSFFSLSFFPELCPDEATFYSNRSAAQFMLRGFEGALEDCAKAVQLNPDLHKVVIWIFFESCSFDMTRNFLHHPFQANIRAAKIHTILGEYEEGLKCIVNVIIRDPRNEEALQEAIRTSILTF